MWQRQQVHSVHTPPPGQNYAAIPGDGLIISEGETRALAGAERDLPVISVTGVDCWQVGGELHPDLAGFNWRGRVVYLAFDSDASRNERVQNNLDRLATALRQRGADVRQVHLPAAPDGSKQGLDDYLARYGVEAFHQLLNSPETVPLVPSDADFFRADTDGSEEHTVAELLEREVGPVQELIPGLIERGIPNFIAGPGGVHKSRLALQWALPQRRRVGVGYRRDAARPEGPESHAGVLLGRGRRR